MSGTDLRQLPDDAARPCRAGVSTQSPATGAPAAERSGAALTTERQRILADAVGKAARAALRKAGEPKASREASGTKVARRRGQVS